MDWVVDHRLLFKSKQFSSNFISSTRLAPSIDDYPVATLLANTTTQRRDINFWLSSEQLLFQPVLLLSPLLSLGVAFVIQNIWWRYTLYWQRLLLLLAGVAANSVLHALLFSGLSSYSISQLFLTTFTGGILLSPFVYLIYEYLHEQHYQMLLDYGTPDKQLRTSLIVWCFLFCVVGLSAQVFLPRN